MMIRSTLFNLVYYGGTIIIGILVLPSLLLPRRLYIPFIRGYFAWVYWCERLFLRLNYRVEGAHYLPSNGAPYIVAAKHQSAYETLKLPLLFSEPIVVLKRELLYIPLWGWYARKAGNIGINRAKPRGAMAEMVARVKQAAGLGRTVVIFPQGTRVRLDQTPAQKPYKRGIFELYQTTGLPVIPLALNSGLFWPRHAFFKRPGTVTFKFLPALPPGLSQDDFMARLEHSLETESALLVEQARARQKPEKLLRYRIANFALGYLAAAIFTYTAAWWGLAYVMQQQINQAWVEAPERGMTLSPPAPRVAGYPGPYRIDWSGWIRNPEAEIYLRHLRLQFFPLPYTPFTITMNGMTMTGMMNNQMFGAPVASIDPDINITNEMNIEHLRLVFEIPGQVPSAWIKPEVQKLADAGVTYRLLDLEMRNARVGDLVLAHLDGLGTLYYDADLQPVGTLDLIFSNPEAMRDQLAQAIPHPMGRSFIGGAIDALTVTDTATGNRTLPLRIKLQSGRVYAGPIKVGHIGHIYWPVVDPAGVNTPAALPGTR